MLGIPKCIQFRHYYINLIIMKWKLLLIRLKYIGRHVLNKIRQNWSKQEVKRYVMTSTNLFIASLIIRSSRQSFYYFTYL
jgi:hypothetical protein